MTLRADLHVHSCHSIKSGNMRFLRSRDCYSRPEAVYRTCKARGMDLVTITDHDSIDGCLEFLDGNPDATDFLMGEEISCRFPDGDIEVHLGVYGLDEQLHRAVQPLRRNVFELTAALREARVLFAVNHLFHFYRSRVPLSSYLRLLLEAPAIEARNGTMLPVHNALTERLASVPEMTPAAVTGSSPRPLAMVGGSDAHTLRRIGTTWTEAPGADASEYLENIRRGLARVGGAHGSVRAVTADAYGVIASYVASLAGFGPCEQPAARRAACLAFSVLSLPAQFVPALITWAGKRREGKEVARVIGLLEPHLRAFEMSGVRVCPQNSQ